MPLPDNADLLRASAALGARVAALLDPDTPMPGATAGSIQPAIQTIAVPTKRGGGAMTEADRTLTAGWGHAGKGGAVMPGRGRIVTRDSARPAQPRSDMCVTWGAVSRGLRLMGPELNANYRACAAAHRPLTAAAPGPES